MRKREPVNIRPEGLRLGKLRLVAGWALGVTVMAVVTISTTLYFIKQNSESNLAENTVRSPKGDMAGHLVTPAPVTPAPVTPAPVTPAPVTPAPVTPAPVTPVQSGSGFSGWMVDFAKAKSESSRQGKPILMEFTGSDWCPPCKALHKNILTSDVFRQQIPKKFILLKLDNPRDKSRQTPEEIAQYRKLSAEYKVRGVPTIIVADANGNEQHRQVGYSSNQTAQQWVDKLKKSVPAVRPASY